MVLCSFLSPLNGEELRMYKFDKKDNLHSGFSSKLQTYLQLGVCLLQCWLEGKCTLFHDGTEKMGGGEKRTMEWRVLTSGRRWTSTSNTHLACHTKKAHGQYKIFSLLGASEIKLVQVMQGKILLCFLFEENITTDYRLQIFGLKIKISAKHSMEKKMRLEVTDSQVL